MVAFLWNIQFRNDHFGPVYFETKKRDFLGIQRIVIFEKEM